MNQIDMLGLFKSLQEEMRAKLELGRAMIPHNGEMGAAAEDSWREWLRKYLPKRYKVDKAFVVDSNGNCSDQIDIVIYDSQYSYFLFNHEQVLYIPAESVYAVIECKQTLNKQNLPRTRNNYAVCCNSRTRIFITIHLCITHNTYIYI